jgi:hypothetical protein
MGSIPQKHAQHITNSDRYCVVHMNFHTARDQSQRSTHRQGPIFTTDFARVHLILNSGDRSAHTNLHALGDSVACLCFLKYCYVWDRSRVCGCAQAPMGLPTEADRSGIPERYVNVSKRRCDDSWSQIDPMFVGARKRRWDYRRMRIGPMFVSARKRRWDDRRRWIGPVFVSVCKRRGRMLPGNGF